MGASEIDLNELTWMNEEWVWARVTLWGSLSLATVVDSLRYWNEQPTGWQLHRAMVVCLVAYMVQETVTLAVIENPEKEEDLNPLMIFVYMLAESLFLGLLLLISTGWHITRNNLKDRKFLFWFPPLHFASSAGYAYIVADVPLEDELLVASDSTKSIIGLCLFISVMTLFYGWWWIYACLAEEKESLHKKVFPELYPAEGDEDTSAGVSAEAEDGVEETVALERIDLSDADDSDEEDVVSARDTPHRDAPELNASEAAAAVGIGPLNRPKAHSPSRRGPGEMREALLDPDTLTAVEEGNFRASNSDMMPIKAKLSLLTRYYYLVQVYLFVTIIIMFADAWSGTLEPAMVVIKELLDWIIMAGLLYVFRLRKSNPYFIISEQDGWIDEESADGEDWRSGLQSDAMGAMAGDTAINPTFRIGGDSDDDHDESST